MAEKVEETLARSAIYELLSLAFMYPAEGAAASLSEGSRKLCKAISGTGWSNIEAAIARFGDELGALDDEALEDSHIEAFGHVASNDCPPYEGEYGQAHIFQKSQTISDLSAFYSAFGVGINPDAKERLDHVSVEMEFMHLLTLKEAYARIHNHGEDKALICRQAQGVFLANHLANWIKEFAARLKQKSGQGVYLSLARLLEAHMDAEFRRFQLDSSPLPLSETRDVPGEEIECGDDVPPVAGGVQEVMKL
ncbi:MAG: molecular chaperone TorD family protein [Chloroflexi bacterium]|nr:molecular chaperone TorD family protein [Chloroflexota bacterium]